MFPHISLSRIDKVNRAIDNPSKQMIALQQSGVIDNKMMDAFGLTKHGHRKFNHTPQSAIMTAYLVDPENAADLAITHLLADKMGNYLHDSVGTDDKEILEGVINKAYSLYKQTNGIKTRKSKKMFF